MNPDQAYETYLETFNAYHEKTVNFNEADTRSKIIDYIFRDCLGWEEKLIKRETSVHSGYLDYELKLNDTPVLVVEAKRTGNYFEIPKSKHNRMYKISGAISSVANLMDALNQVHSYCIDIGCKYAAIFNGYQLIAFPAITIGRPWREGFCTIYNSLEDIKNTFSLFWNTFSVENVATGSLLSYLEKTKSTTIFSKVISELYHPDQSWARNELYTYLQPYCDFVFSELLDETRTEVLKECYVHDRSSKPLAKEIEGYFIDKLPHFADNYNIMDIIEDRLKSNVFQKKYSEQTAQKGQGSLMALTLTRTDPPILSQSNPPILDQPS